MAAKKRTATKKRTPAKATDSLPTEFELGGEEYRVTPRDEWTMQQDDWALSVMMGMSRNLTPDSVESGDGMAIVDRLVETGLYRKMLGIALERKGDPRTIQENVEHFQGIRIDVSNLAPVVAVVAAFFGSGNS